MLILHLWYNGQLKKSTNGDVICTYTYSNDIRGNILTKTVNGVTTSFEYQGDEEFVESQTNKYSSPDRLKSVNSISLSYDKIGNVTAFGTKSFTWADGRNLVTITDSSNNDSIFYTYNRYGYRTSKTVNGVATNYIVDENGTVIAQKTGNDTLYFEYDNYGSPLGFVYNGVQYLYITNIRNDVIAITDTTGTVVAGYTYGDWGECTVDSTSTNLALANLNPLRYRGYYYDNETQMYYLQSRYYNPEWCRFISADDFDYIDSNSKFSINAYAYCINSPLMYSDSFGNYTTENWFEAALRVLCISIEVDAITKTFETIVKSINTTFDLNIWFNGLPEVVQKTIADFSLFLVTAINTIWVKLLDTFSLEKLEEILEGFTFDKMCQVLIDKSISDCMSMFKALFDSIENLNKGEHKPYQVVIEFATDLIFIVLPVVYPSLSPIILYIGGIFATLTEQIIFDFDNGIYIR